MGVQVQGLIMWEFRVSDSGDSTFDKMTGTLRVQGLGFRF